MNNPLLNFSNLPRFASITAEHALPALDVVLTQAREAVAQMMQQDSEFTFENFVVPLADVHEKITRVWGPVGHLNAVINSPALREAYTAGIPKITQYFTELKQNQKLFEIYKKIQARSDFVSLDTAAQKIVNDAVRDFKLAGVDLPEAQKNRFKAIATQLGELGSKYGDHVLDDTNEYELILIDRADIAGLPESIIQAAHERAVTDKKAAAGAEVWKFTLEGPSFGPFMKYAQSEPLRKKMYLASMARGTAGLRDNTPLITQILQLRQEMASLLDYKNYAEYSLATKMAKTPAEVNEFLEQLLVKSHAQAQKEIAELKAYKKNLTGIAEFFTWDFAYYAEKLRQERYDFSEEELKEYFPEQQVLLGLFETIYRLYGYRATIATAETWHPSVKFYELKDDAGKIQGQLFLDLQARPNKRGGAWMDECVARKKSAQGIQIPAAYINCNFSGPVGDKPALYTHEEVRTLFHECGHALHHVLSKVDYLDVSGINGVPWDGVELPSQFFENWIWDRAALDLFAKHYVTGKIIPEALHGKMLAAKNYLAGYAMIRQLAFAMFDMGIHCEIQDFSGIAVHQFLENVWHKAGLLALPEQARFENSFSHIFGGGYAAGYYSYKWAEVLSADAFAKFEEHGIFDRKTGREFLQSILEQGGAEDFMKLFVAFRGRKPSIEALLKQSGIK